MACAFVAYTWSGQKRCQPHRPCIHLRALRYFWRFLLPDRFCFRVLQCARCFSFFLRFSFTFCFCGFGFWCVTTLPLRRYRLHGQQSQMMAVAVAAGDGDLRDFFTAGVTPCPALRNNSFPIFTDTSRRCVLQDGSGISHQTPATGRVRDFNSGQ